MIKNINLIVIVLLLLIGIYYPSLVIGDIISKANSVNYNDSIPILNDGYTQNGNLITITGLNFKSNATIYINGYNIPIKPIVNNDNTSLSFTLPILKCNLIESNILFNGVPIGNYTISKFKSTNLISEQIRKYYGDGSIDFKLQNIDCNDTISLPTIKIKGYSYIYNCSLPIHSNDDYVITNCKLPKTTVLRLFTISFNDISFTLQELKPILPIFKSIKNESVSTSVDGKVEIKGVNFASLNSLIPDPPYTIMIKMNDIRCDIEVIDYNTLYAFVPYSLLPPISSTLNLDVQIYFRNDQESILNEVISFKESEIINITSIAITGVKEFIIYGKNIKSDFKVTIPQFNGEIPCQLIVRNSNDGIDCDLLICSPPEPAKIINDTDTISELTISLAIL